MARALSRRASPCDPSLRSRSRIRSWDASGTTPAARPQTRLRIPSLGSIIFIGFAIFTALRLIGGLASSDEQPTVTQPAGVLATPAANGATPSKPGTVSFGTAEDANCGVTDRAEAFPAGVAVWWTAYLSSEQRGTDRVQVLVKHDGRQVGQSIGPGEDSTEPWDVLCAGNSITQPEPGVYRVEVRTYDGLKLLAAGEFRRL